MRKCKFLFFINHFTLNKNMNKYGIINIYGCQNMNNKNIY